MVHVLMERTRSLRSRRQVDVGTKAPEIAPAGSALPTSILAQEKASRDEQYTRPRRGEASSEQRDLLQYTHRTSTIPSISPSSKLQLPETMIGVALGSPGESPLPPLPQEEASYADRLHHLQTQVSYNSGDQDVLRSKGSRWKALGGLFGKKSSSGQRPSAPSPQNVGHSSSATRPHQDYHRPRMPRPL